MREFKISDVWSMSPWSQSPTTPNIPGVTVPHAPRAPSAPRVRRPVPRIDDLFDVQADLVKAINFLRDFEHKFPEEASNTQFQRARTNVKNAYRIINRYLTEYGR